MCDKENNRHKETSSTYGDEGKGKNPRTSEKKEKTHDGCVIMYECGKKVCH